MGVGLGIGWTKINQKDLKAFTVGIESILAQGEV